MPKVIPLVAPDGAPGSRDGVTPQQSAISDQCKRSSGGGHGWTRYCRALERRPADAAELWAAGRGTVRLSRNEARPLTLNALRCGWF